MTMLTIIISSVVLLKFGLSGRAGMFFVMAIAGMVCTALAVSGQTITDLKTGYWLGSTPAAQERVKFLGVLASALAAGIAIVILAHSFQFGDSVAGDARPVLAAPQASIMKALVEGFMSQQPVAYVLFGVGAIVAVMLEMIKVPALTFALGMYLPLYLNLPALVGGVMAHMIDRRSERTGGERGQTVRERGIVIASGFMAGGALGGMIGAALRLDSGFALHIGSWHIATIPAFSEEWVKTPFFTNEPISQMVSLGMFFVVCVYLWLDANKRLRT
jgi:putative OPT family oligopeptide transporter